jgi:hypothetical protein
MRLDLWTKAMLTMIAIALSVIAWKLPLIETGHAQLGGCGSSDHDPCYVVNTPSSALQVIISNPREPSR